jgi:hypothetical protein
MAEEFGIGPMVERTRREVDRMACGLRSLGDELSGVEGEECEAE